MTTPEEQEPPIREFADRGILWLLESPQNLRDLLALIAYEIADRLDFSRAQRLNRSFIPEDLHKQEADLLYRVPFRKGKGEVWVYILLEHQSKPDSLMGLRLLAYMVAIWETQRRGWEDARTSKSKRRLLPILPIVFYTGKRRWSTPISLKAVMYLPELLERFVPKFDSLLLKLQETPAEALTGSAVASALRVLRDAEAPFAELEQVLVEAVTALEGLSEAEQAEWARAMHYLLLLIRHKREPEERTELYELVAESVQSRRAEEVRKMAMTDAQVLLARGRREGRLEEGREILLELLEEKFGPLEAKTVAAINALAERRLRNLTRRVLTATSLSELGL